LAKYLGVEGYGVYSYVVTLLMFLSLPINAGFANLSVRETSKALVDKNFSLIHSLICWFSNVSNIYFCCLLLCLGAFYFYKPLLVENIRFKLLLIGFLLIILTAKNSYQSAVIRGLGRMISSVISDSFVRPFLFLSMILLTLFLDYSLTSKRVMVLHVASVFVSFLLCSFLLYINLPANRIKPYPKINWAKAALPLTLTGGIQMMNIYLDILILGIFHDDSDVGIYRSASSLAIFVSFALSVINPMLHPAFTKYYYKAEYKKLQEIVSVSSFVIMIISIIPFLSYLLWGETIIGYVYDESFKMGYMSLLILSVGQFANAFCGPVLALLNMTGNDKLAMNGMIYTLVLNIILAFCLTPKFGIEGCATATAVSMVFWNLLLRIYVARTLNIETISIFSLNNILNIKHKS
jgi:O-antigen/teichoic acid export membrane protein